MTRVKWILDGALLEYHNITGLPDIIRSQGHDCFVTKFSPPENVPSIPFKLDDCVIFYGSHIFVRAISSVYPFQPGALGLSRSDFATYMSNMPLDWFINSDAVMTTWRMFLSKKEQWFDIFDADIFIRPNSGFKTFAGQVLTRENFDFETNSISQITSVMDETVMVVSSAKSIISEFRFVIANGKVVAHSHYSWDDSFISEVPAECLEKANQVAKHTWQPDIAYTCDIALTGDGAKIVELNSFSCAGLYKCSLEDVVREVSKAALLEHESLI